MVVGGLDIRMTAPAGACTGGTEEDKKVPPETRPATVTILANSCSHPNPIFTRRGQPIQKDDTSSKGSPIKLQT